VHCTTFYQSALRHEEFEDVMMDVTPPSGCPFFTGILVVLFCSDLPVKRGEEDCASDFHNSYLKHLGDLFIVTSQLLHSSLYILT